MMPEKEASAAMTQPPPPPPSRETDIVFGILLILTGIGLVVVTVFAWMQFDRQRTANAILPSSKPTSSTITYDSTRSNQRGEEEETQINLSRIPKTVLKPFKL